MWPDPKLKLVTLQLKPIKCVFDILKHRQFESHQVFIFLMSETISCLRGNDSMTFRQHLFKKIGL